MFVERDGARIFCQVRGSGEPSLLFIHGVAAGHEVWGQHATYFSASRRVAAIDLRGHGQSSTADDYSQELFVADVGSVIDAAELQRPVLVGWSAVTNSLAWAPVVLFLVMFFWTPPHFWALAIKYRDDYAAAGVPMLPAVASLEETASRIILYTVILVALSVVFAPVAGMGLLYLVSALVLGAVFGAFALAVRRDPGERTAMRLFTYSITYITLLFGAITLDVVV